VLDEAHHFLNKTLGDENARYVLDSFELLAKEGRKHSLNLCIATQRPRDIPEGILSQMGTLVIHRLTNDQDREMIERASSEVDRTALDLVPGLQEGHAVIVGVDFPIPLTVQILKPAKQPDSRSPDYQGQWRAAAVPDQSQSDINAAASLTTD
jgi:DNA helicase HerA-like ATPase